ncbi:MAG: methyltransferase domain-containing protein [Thermoplasmata archaeon]
MRGASATTDSPPGMGLASAERSMRNLPTHPAVGATGFPRRDTIELLAKGNPPTRLLFVEHRERIYVISSESTNRWSSSALREGGCEIRRQDGQISRYATALVVDSAEAAEAWFKFCEKYGTDLCRRYFGNFPRTIVLDPQRISSPRSAYELLEQEFDARAGVYDEAIQAKPIERYLKEQALGLIQKGLRGLDPILEIGPGTGFHTLPLLREGHWITAVDVSEGMLRVLGERAREAQVSSRLTIHAGSLGSLDSILRPTRSEGFGAIFSAFGAFNLEPNIRGLADVLADRMKPGGRLAFTTLNRPGGFPVLWELATGRPRAALARFGTQIPPAQTGYTLETYPRSPTDWDRLLLPRFRRIGCEPVSVLAPPFDSPRALRGLGAAAVANLGRFDRRLSRHSWMVPASGWVFLTYVLADPPPGGPPPVADTRVAPTEIHAS